MIFFISVYLRYVTPHTLQLHRSSHQVERVQVFFAEVPPVLANIFAKVLIFTLLFVSLNYLLRLFMKNEEPHV